MEEETKLEKRLHFWGDTSEEAYYAFKQIQSSTSFYTSPRGISLFTRSWIPTTPIRGLVFMIHGYGNDISWTFQSTPIFLAQHGFACFALDLEGHGRSIILFAADGFSYIFDSASIIPFAIVSFRMLNAIFLLNESRITDTAFRSNPAYSASDNFSGLSPKTTSKSF